MSTSATFENQTEFEESVASVRNDASDDLYVIVQHIDDDPCRLGVLKVGQNVEEIAAQMDSTQVLECLEHLLS